MATKQEMMVMALAVKQSLIEKEQVQECMDLQAALKEAKGVDLPLTQIALKKGYLTAEQVANLTGADVPGVGDKVSITSARRIPIFDIHREIGQGGMASVFLATNKKTGDECALKVLFPKHTKNAKFVERFIREGRLLKQFDCDNIARGFDYGVVGKDGPEPLYFMSMEYIDGMSIQDLLDRDGPLAEDMATWVITEASRGLAYMQEHGVVHRDVKPDNIMWANDGRVMLVDLGFATPIRKDLAGQYEDETCGTVQYISPEQAKGMADLDIRADIYSLGATLYHMILGELPFSGKDSMDIMAKQVMEGLDALKMKGGKISVHMHYFIEKMMSKDRDFRYQTAREVVDDIEEVLQGAADLQFNPADFDAGGDPHASQSITQIPGLSGRQGATTSVRRNPVPSNGSVRMPSSNTTSIRRPALKKKSGPVKPGSSVRLPSSGSSIRKPKTLPNGKSVRMPNKRKPGS